MRIMGNEEKVEKLCKGFSLLDEKDQEKVFGVLEGLLFAKLKNDVLIANAIPLKESKIAV